MLCLHYYSNYVTVRIDEDDEYSLDQIKEFELVCQPWSDVVAVYGETGTATTVDFPLQFPRIDPPG